MPNPYNNKVQLADGTVLIDLSNDTLSSADQLLQGIVAHDRTGAVITGTNVPDNALIITLTDNPDWDGESDDFLLKDKTFAEIRAAYFAGKTIAVYYGEPYGLATCRSEFSERYPQNDYFQVTVRTLSDFPNGIGEYTFTSRQSDEWEYDSYAPWSWGYEMAVYWDNQSNKWVLDEIDYSVLKANIDVGAMPISASVDSYDSDLSAIADCYWDYDNEVLVYTVRQNDNGLIKEYSYTFGEGDVTTLIGYHEYSTPPSAGTEGTPVATKGTVSNHSISVTPSVTNTGGVIQGGTHTGTAVTVSASELVSGTYTVDSAGTKDVTNYASASIASGTEGTPSATKGTVSNHSVTVTPSVTNTSGWITGGTKTGTAVTVSASELVSGSQTITQNGTVDVTNLASVTVDVQGGGSTGPQMGQASRTLASASSSISFTGLQGEPTSFILSCTTSLTTGASPFKVAAVVFDGTNLHGQIVTNTSNAQATYDGSSFSKTYSNGTLTVSSTGPYFQATEYALDYSYGGTSANVVTRDVQVGSGATSIQFTNLPEATLLFYSVIFKSNFSTSSGYQRVMWEGERSDGEGGFGMAMDSQANVNYAWSSYGAGTSSMTVSSDSTSRGGYFHQPGYYQLTAVYEDIEPQEIDVVPLSVTTNGTYTAPSGTAYSPVTVNVSSSGSVNVATTTWSNTDSSATSHTFTGLSGTPKAAFLRCTSSLSRSSSSSNYYVADMRWTGTATAGNSYRRSNGSYANVTSGYSFSASGTSLTVTTTGTSTSNPGSFYNGTYELTYIY